MENSGASGFFFFWHSVHLFYRSCKYELHLTLKPSGSWHRQIGSTYVHLESGSATTQQRNLPVVSELSVGYRSSKDLDWFDSGAETMAVVRRATESWEDIFYLLFSSCLSRQPTAVMRAAPFPLPSSDSRKVTSH